ncbi:hypothetical protein ACPJHQ_26075 [Rossellomorea sp. H39__3]
MRKFSRFDLLNNTVLDNAGGIVSRFFESKVVRIDVETSIYDLKRAQVFVGTVNEIIEEQTDIVYTMEMLLAMIVQDFLRAIEYGLTLEDLAKWVRSLQEPPESPGEIKVHHYQGDGSGLNLEDLKAQYRKQSRRTEEKTHISARIEKKYILRGEVLLHDLREVAPDLDIGVEEFVSLRFKDIMQQIKQGNYEVLKNIVDLVMR